MVFAVALLLAFQATPLPKPVAPRPIVAPQSITLAKMRQEIALHSSVTGEMISKTYGQPGKGTFAYLAPGFFKLSDERVSVYSDGIRGIEIRHEEKTYRELEPTEVQDLGSAMPGFSAVLPGARPTKSNGPEQTEKLGEVDVITIPINTQGAPDDYEGVLYVDTKTLMPLMLRAKRNKVVTEEYKFQNIVFDAPLTAADFPLTPPEGYREAKSGDEVIPTAKPPTAPPIDVATTSPASATPETGSATTAPSGFRGVAGQWLNGFKVSQKIGTGKVLDKPYWTFVVYSKNSTDFDWASAVCQARVTAGWRRAIYLGTSKDGGMILGCEKKEGAMPTALSINVREKNATNVTRFGFEWKKAPAKKG
ncbi:hypothetical protein EON81_01850 [bacterium]|nr:MAG: hypothetical protein EON81_01850 [bacterium]